MVIVWRVVGGWGRLGVYSVWKGTRKSGECAWCVCMCVCMRGDRGADDVGGSMCIWWGERWWGKTGCA